MKNRWPVFFAVWIALAGALPCHANEPPAIVASRVPFVHEPAAADPAGGFRQEVVRSMVDGLLMELTGRKSGRDAWQTLLHPAEVVGIKVSASGHRAGGTKIETILAVVRGLRDAGFSRAQIVVWDKSREDLLEIGLRENHPDYRLAWIDPASGFDAQSPVDIAVPGKLIWGDGQFAEGGSPRFSDMAAGGARLSTRSSFSRVLVREVTRVIHIPSLQDSYHTGINGAFAGMVLGNLDNWRRFVRPPAFGDPFLPEIYAMPQISQKMVLTLLDGLFLQYGGGPFPNPAATIPNNTLFISYDPVAMDATARRLVNEARAGVKLPPVNPQSAYIETAAAMGLGVAEDSRIHVIRARRAALRNSGG